MSEQAPVQLRWLANDCEERARLTGNQEAERIYRTIARLSRLTALAPDLASDERHACLVELRKGLEFARWLDGEEPAERPSLPSMPRLEAQTIAGELLKVSQLSARFGISERGARAAIERNYGKRTGFHRIGGLWFAEPDAFARVIR